MRYKTATEIVKLKGIDINEDFPYIEIPQANLPKDGEPAPKLKIAVKDGEEYFDIATGQMLSFESDSSDVESNVFAETATAISAADLMDESELEEQQAVEEAVSVPEVKQAEELENAEDGIVNRGPVTFEKLKKQEEEEEQLPAVKLDLDSAAEQETKTVSEPEAVFEPEIESEPQETAAVEKHDVFTPAAEPEQPKTAPKLIKKPASSGETAAAPQLIRKPVSDGQPSVITAPQLNKKPAAPPTQPEAPVQTAPKLKKKKTSLVDGQGEPIADSTDINLTEGSEEDEDNLYTAALIQMLRANRSKHQLMKDVDTRHVYKNGDSQLQQTGTPELTMEGINMKKYDSSRLASPFEEDRGNALTREEKYRNIKIDDMLNPMLGNKSGRTGYQPDAIEQFQKNKIAKKKANLGILKASLAIAAIFIAVILLKLFEII